MNAYDIQLAIQRRRLLAALKYQKAYLDSIYIEYTGENFETSVRPSLPLSLDTDIDKKLDVEIKNARVCKSMPAELEISLPNPDFGLTIGMGNPLTYEFEGGTVDITPLVQPDIDAEVGFLDPTPIKNKNLQINADLVGRVKELPLPPIGAFNFQLPQLQQVPISATLSELVLTRAYLDDLNVQATFAGNIEKIKVQDIPAADIQVGAAYNHINNIDLATMQSLTLDTKVEAKVLDGITVSEYYLATLTKIDNNTLATLADMPLNARYIDTSVAPPVFAAARS
jgi:hypothetical protein